MFNYKEELAGYCVGGKLEKWKTNADRLFDKKWLLQVFENLDNGGFLPENVVVVSVAAYQGTHEEWLQELLSKRGGKVIAGDIISTPNTNKTDFVRWNARDLPIKDESCDIVLDIRGALWYAAHLDEIYCLGGALWTDKMFCEYKRILKPGGVVMVDDWDVGRVVANLGWMAWKTVGSSGNLPTERSTGEKLHRVEKAVKRRLESNLGFDGFEPAVVTGDGKSRMKIFKKGMEKTVDLK